MSESSCNVVVSGEGRDCCYLAVTCKVQNACLFLFILVRI